MSYRAARSAASRLSIPLFVPFRRLAVAGSSVLDAVSGSERLLRPFLLAASAVRLSFLHNALIFLSLRLSVGVGKRSLSGPFRDRPSPAGVFPSGSSFPSILLMKKELRRSGAAFSRVVVDNGFPIVAYPTYLFGVPYIPCSRNPLISLSENPQNRNYKNHKFLFIFLGLDLL